MFVLSEAIKIDKKAVKGVTFESKRGRRTQTLSLASKVKKRGCGES